MRGKLNFKKITFRKSRSKEHKYPCTDVQNSV